jgi:hypothetical protein
MIILTNTTDKIQVKLGTTVTTTQLRCFASYRDTTTTSISPLRNVLNTNNTTNVDLVGSPASSTQRIVDYISIYNSDTGNETVTISFNDNGTLYELFVATLASGEKIEYQEGLGFKVMSNAGSVKTSVNQGNNTLSSSMTSVVLGSDVINNNAVANTIQDVTGLSFPVNSGQRYYFKFIINYSSAAAANGSRWSINGPSFSDLSYTSAYALTVTTQSLNHGVNTYDTPAGANATTPSLTGNISIIEGFLTASASGTVIARFASELANTAITAKAGSVVYYQQL